ncbi:hypothetical protein AB1Y20_011049 [Prymnesium parvum]|uniref:TLC domain-containing protein n=1 Tax=Prymnesium parvum TaxID=97485 RepID=A0AB34INH6_PRYPA
MFSPVVHPQHVQLLASLTAAFSLGFLLLLELSLIPMRKFTLRHSMRPSVAVFLSSCIVSMANALCTSGFAASAFYELTTSSQPISLTMAAPESLVRSCAITCAYFIADCYQMVRYREDSKREMGAMGMAIMWFHHSVSLVLWPYSVLTNKCAFFVSFFLFTEITNIGQNIFHACNKGNLGSKITAVVGSCWLVSFFVVRIVPMPWLVYHYVKLHWEGGVGQTGLETVVSLVTIPLPWMLNTYWFILLSMKAIRMLRGGCGTRAQAAPMGTPVLE